MVKRAKDTKTPVQYQRVSISQTPIAEKRANSLQPTIDAKRTTNREDQMTITPDTPTTDNVALLRIMVKGAYDLQALRMQMGMRLCANFRARLKKIKGEDAEDVESEVVDGEVREGDDDELSKEALKVIKELKESYRRLCDGIARNRTLPAEKGFVGDELISEYSEIVLVGQYIDIEKQEAKQFRQMTTALDKIPVYTQYLKHQKGIGPAMAGALISTLDPHKARHASSFWRYSGIDVAEDGRGRSRRAEHLIERSYKTKDGKDATRMGITYNPWLKTKLFTLAASFMRLQSPWVQVYSGYKHRLQTDPSRTKCELAEFKKLGADGKPTAHLWTKGRIDMASKRYMVKMFLLDFWKAWRTLEGLPVGQSYAEAKLGMPPHGQAAE